MIKYAYRVISDPSEEGLEKALNEAGNDGWEIAKFSTIYSEEKGPLFIAVLMAQYEEEEQQPDRAEGG